MQNKLKNVKSINKEVDVFLEGKVIARNIVNEQNQACSLGYVLPGEYEVTVEDSESVEVLGGDFSILLPDIQEFVNCKVGDKFYVPKGETYKLIVKDFFDYYCIFGL